MTCDPYQYELAWYASKAGEKRLPTDLTGHLKECSDCSERWSTYQEQAYLLSRADFPAVTSYEWEQLQERVLAQTLSPEENSSEVALTSSGRATLPWTALPRRRFRISELAKVAAIFLVGILAGTLGYRWVKKPLPAGIPFPSRNSSGVSSPSLFPEREPWKTENDYFLGGLQLDPLSPSERNRWNVPNGLIVRTIDPQGMRTRVENDLLYGLLRQLQAGSILLSLNARKLKTRQDFIREIKTLQNRKTPKITLKILNHGTIRQIVIQSK